MSEPGVPRRGWQKGFLTNALPMHACNESHLPPRIENLGQHVSLP